MGTATFSTFPSATESVGLSSRSHGAVCRGTLEKTLLKKLRRVLTQTCNSRIGDIKREEKCILSTSSGSGSALVPHSLYRGRAGERAVTPQLFLFPNIETETADQPFCISDNITSLPLKRKLNPHVTETTPELKGWFPAPVKKKKKKEDEPDNYYPLSNTHTWQHFLNALYDFVINVACDVWSLLSFVFVSTPNSSPSFRFFHFTGCQSGN